VTASLPVEHSSLFSPRPRQTRRYTGVALALCLATTALGCSGFWDGVRERQRQASIDLARDLAGRGECRRALPSLERAQTRRQLGAFAAESIYLKARCLALVGRLEESLAHWRMVSDQYEGSSWASRIPNEVLPLLGSGEPYRAHVAPTAFEIPRPRYGNGARRASVAGPVWIDFRLDGEGRPHDLRVIGAAHPLLAGYALEAVASGKWRKSAGTNTPLPRRASSAFRFESLWMDEADVEPQTGETTAPTPDAEPPPTTADDAPLEPDEERDDSGVEWFPGR
jgi:hypothetical protein